MFERKILRGLMLGMVSVLLLLGPALIYAQDEPPVKDEEDVSVGEVAPVVTGVPIPFGYVYTDSDEPGGPTYGWVDITGTGTSVPVGDDTFHGPYAIGFTFNFYGNNYTQFYVDSNGYLSFQTGSSDLVNDCPLPSTNTPDNFIAGIWDDLDPRQTGDGVYYQSFAAGTCPTGYGGACLVVLWDVNHYPYTGGDDVIFEIILFDGSNDFLIQIQNASSETGSGSTTGIENADGSIGLTYACNSSGSIKNNLAILFFEPELLEWGDAPTSWNHGWAPMTAYPSGGPPGILANFPVGSVLAFGWGFGICHDDGPTYLGPAVAPSKSMELDADMLPDADGVTNIAPPSDIPDRDGHDDGATFPLPMPSGDQNYSVTVTGVCAAEGCFLNIWADWNRDGDWDDGTVCGSTPTADDEWAAINFGPIAGGPFNVQVPIVPCHPGSWPANQDGPVWVRVTLVPDEPLPEEEPWSVGALPAPPPDGCLGDGETEDYYLDPTTLTLVKDLVNDDGGPLDLDDFQVSLNGRPPVPFHNRTFYPLPGLVTLSEVEKALYKEFDWAGDCSGPFDNGTITLAYGDDKTCTISNDDWGADIWPHPDYNYVDTEHTVYVDISVPVADVDVLLEVTGVNSASGSPPSNSAGVAEFTYFGANTGLDYIEACVDTNDNGRCDAREPTASATKYWIEPWEEPPGIVEEGVPEPATMLLFGSGLIGLAGYARLRLRKR